ncbi:MAG: DUF1292 domain-containing protein [Clostridia bacterium]
MDEERDIVVFTDEEGNDVELEVIDYFIHNDEEYAILIDAYDEDACEHEDVECSVCDHDHDYELYIMKVVINEDMEEFIPIDESQADELLAIVEKRINEEMYYEFEDDE